MECLPYDGPGADEGEHIVLEIELGYPIVVALDVPKVPNVSDMIGRCPMRPVERVVVPAGRGTAVS